MARERNRTAPVHEGDSVEWFTVETEDGNAVAGVDAVFDFDSEKAATAAVQVLAAQVGKPLSVVSYTREVLGTYAAVTEVKKVG